MLTISGCPRTAKHAKRVDYEYERAGTATIFMFAEPLACWREVAVRERKTKIDWVFQGWMQRTVGAWIERLVGVNFPVGTLAVNMTACLAIGLLGGFLAGPQLIREEYRIGLTVGVLGGYSTFSTFGLESFNLANDGEYWFALANMVISCVVGSIAVWIGYRMSERWFGA